MSVTRADILKSIRRRRARSGLLTADRYFRSIEASFDGGFRPTDLFARSTHAQWEQALDRAASQLVYADPAARVEPQSIQRSPGTPAAAATGPAAAVMDFEAVVTTTRRDRDRDIMESKGALVDPRAVLLWQHIPLQPIGRLLAVTEHTPERVKARLSIADTPLGRDAAVLVEFGALKISHGFEPIEFKPLDDTGWHFLKFEIYEISLVSVPSNKDAVVTAYDRRRLHSPLIKGWAASLSGARIRPGIGWSPDQNVPAAGDSPAGGIKRTDLRSSPVTGDSASTDPLPSTRSVPAVADHSSQLDESPRTACRTGCARFIAEASLACVEDLPELQAAGDALEQIIERLRLASATC